MKYWLLVNIFLWVLSYFLFRQTNRAGDDFGAVFPLIIIGVIAIGSTAIYVFRAFWVHQFW